MLRMEQSIKPLSGLKIKGSVNITLSNRLYLTNTAV